MSLTCTDAAELQGVTFDAGYAILALARREKILRGRVRYLRHQLTRMKLALKEARMDAGTQQRRGDLWKAKFLATEPDDLVSLANCPDLLLRIHNTRHSRAGESAEYHDITFHGAGYAD